MTRKRLLGALANGGEEEGGRGDGERSRLATIVAARDVGGCAEIEIAIPDFGFDQRFVVCLRALLSPLLDGLSRPGKVTRSSTAGGSLSAARPRFKAARGNE